ncbi:uncharacterized protein METZ01_LOCUS92005 [marine metagenome]|uniref:Uncharacterized protein n=1 Tax=marine metagenome TaxID=408172 RepID=A0A381VGK6_9ZZZZ
MDGSFTTIPRPLSQISVFAVPRSMATSPDIQLTTFGNNTEDIVSST